MKARALNLCLILTSFIGYLEWGKDKKMFLLQGEIEIIIKIFSDPKSAIHPFVVLPLLGQILLLITLFQTKPARVLTIFGIVCLCFLLGFIFFIGLISLNFKILFSAIPFLITAFLTIKNLRKLRVHKSVANGNEA